VTVDSAHVLPVRDEGVEGGPGLSRIAVANLAPNEKAEI